MVRQATQAFTSWLNESKFAFVLIFWLGILTQQVFTLAKHPGEAAHEDQLGKQIRTEEAIIRLREIDERVLLALAQIQKEHGMMKNDILTTVAKEYADDRLRKSDFTTILYRMLRGAEKLNPDWTAPDPFRTQ